MALLLFSALVHAQNLIIKGKIKCLNTHENSSKGAENVVVIPTFIPARATITASFPSGYFEINTGLPLSSLQDKTVTLHALSRCADCRETSKRVFISEDRDRQNKVDQKTYVTIKDWMLKTNCQKAELKPMAADSVLNIITQQPEQNLDKVSTTSVLTGTPALLNLLTSLTTVVGAAGFPVGRFDAYYLNPGKIRYGQSLLGSPLFHSAATGFNFSPSRDMSEAALWNPSAMALSRKAGNISLLCNFKNMGKLTGFYRVTDKFSLGAGAIFSLQDEYRRARFSQNQNLRWEDSLSLKMIEYGAFVSGAYQINSTLSAGATIKWVGQTFDIPNFATEQNDGRWSFTDSTIDKQSMDVDISATYKPSSHWQFGLNLMNLAGSKLYKDAFIPKQSTRLMQPQRALGLGITYKWQRLNAGIDLLANQDGLFDASVGVNYVPFNHALISAGITLKQLSYSLAFRIKHFRIAYIHDNNLMVNEKRKAKIDVFNGQLYGGFVFDLD